MPKTKISEFDVDPANNTDINNINIAEGCAPSGINNAIRQLMSDLKEFQTGAGGDSITAVGVFSDTVGEKTSGAGVTVDGVLLKDNAVTASGGFSGAINGTVGATTANTGAFTTVSATGNITMSGTGHIKLPVGTTAQRSGSPADGMLRYNSDLDSFEGYVDGAWGGVGGAQAGGVIYENNQTVTANYTMTTNKNGMSAGAITIANGITVTIPTGSTWVIL
jgi:hypothetical protein